MRNPKVSIEKAQGKGLLYPCPKCPLADDMWYTHFPSPYGCCHYGGLQAQCYHQEPCSPCLAAGQTADKGKACKVRLKNGYTTSTIYLKSWFVCVGNMAPIIDWPE